MTARSAARAAVRAPARGLSAVGRGFRAAVVAGRWVVMGLWLAAAVAAVLLPTPSGGGGSNDFGSLLPPESEAAQVQERSLTEFRVPVLSQTAVVVHDPGGLSALTRADIALWALQHTQPALRGEAPTADGNIVAAVPLPTSTPETAVTYLYTTGGTSLSEGTALARQYAQHFRNQPDVETYVTGITPARVQQAEHLGARLHLFEVATLVLIAVVVGLTFRSVVAPLVVLAAAGIGYVVATYVLARAAAAFGFSLPDQLRPLTAALLIGVVTDYCVLFFSGMRRHLEAGMTPKEAARRTVTTDGPIVAVAGLTVAAGTAALLVADFELFRAFGPALSLTVVVGVAVSLTLVPALIAVLGPRLFFPSGVARGGALDRRSGRGARWMARATSTRRGAWIAVLIGLGVLVPAAVPLADLRLDLSFSSGLPSDDPVRQGAELLDESGVRGVVAPTEVLVEAPGIADQRGALARLQSSIAAQPGVAQVLGPAQNPLPEEFGIVFSAAGDIARFVVILDSDPLAADAIEDLRLLRDRLPGLLEEAGVDGATVGVAGQTAVAAELALITQENLWRTMLAALIVEFVILALFLRAVLAPLLLLVTSALGVAASLGISVLVFQGLFDDPGLTFYVPFTTAVLLLALGSDYNVFAVGSIWDEAGRRPLREAIVVAMPATARAISAAGVILAATFAMVAIIPLDSFRQVAFIMALGLLIDTFLIRPVLTPAVLTLLGRAAGWPSGRIRISQAPLGAAEQDALLEERAAAEGAGREPATAGTAGPAT
ncbi:MMPL family transporter [Blastococcus xanthinilyticus]|uniref:RND superfamily putative drug exporter n=1 Tax=Blastococcus xanthinilyticus TaxID=1564164 RepID=A0A5S5D2C7_9ACTN|nr:MMPL family transporter [Blastococcus xanthinilyticus]TYP89564.1 RND superfamily putative drug exporter [Blastococcus xanthinilyticus]